MDQDLRVALWNAYLKLWKRAGRDLAARLGEAIWTRFFKLPLDDLEPGFGWLQEVHEEVKQHFLRADWWAVYDYLEFVVAEWPPQKVADFRSRTNLVLEEGRAGYRLVAGRVVDVTSQDEVEAIELAASCSLAPAARHLNQAVALLADRRTPDYRNSIKESISAVEATTCLIAGDQKATLGQALKVLETRGVTHPALKGAFDRLYGWTCDDQGIRHALLDEPTLDFADAKFMLVACSAFVNYLLAKSAEV